MPEVFDKLTNALARLPGFGKKSAERVAFHLAIAKKQDAHTLICAIQDALEHITTCPNCGGISENGETCAICSDTNRTKSVCLVETPADMGAIEKTGVWHGTYIVLGGKLSPIKNVSERDLNFSLLENKAKNGEISELVLALSNDIEGEATCHYISKKIAEPYNIPLARIGFGLPSGSQLGFADASTIKSALDYRKSF